MLYLTYLNELFETMIVKYFVSFHLIFPSSIKILIMLNGRQNSLYHVHIYAHRLACTACTHALTHSDCVNNGAPVKFQGFNRTAVNISVLLKFYFIPLKFYQQIMCSHPAIWLRGCIQNKVSTSSLWLAILEDDALNWLGFVMQFTV